MYNLFCRFVQFVLRIIISQINVVTFTLYLSGLVPLFQFCNREYFEHRDAAKRLDELVCYSEKIWEFALSNLQDYQGNKLNSRRLQDEIFEHRTKSPLILDKFYNLFRDQNEVLMNRTSEILIDEAKIRMKKSR